MRTCTICGTPNIEGQDACPVCSDESRWPDMRIATGEERLAEFERWGNTLEIDWDQFHKRIDQIFGRPVWNHELATSNLTNLRVELLTRIQPTIEDVIAVSPIPVIRFDMSESNDNSAN